MPKTVTKSEFIKYLKSKNIIVLKEEHHFDPNTPSEPIVTFVDEKVEFSDTTINFDLHYPGDALNVRNCLMEGRKINLIKIVRHYTGMGLREAKELCDRNMENWSKLYLDSLPFEKLPQMVNGNYCKTFKDTLLEKLRMG